MSLGSVVGDRLRLVGRDSDIKGIFSQDIGHEFFPKYIGFQRNSHILVFRWPGHLLKQCWERNQALIEHPLRPEPGSGAGPFTAFFPFDSCMAAGHLLSMQQLISGSQER